MSAWKYAIEQQCRKDSWHYTMLNVFSNQITEGVALFSEEVKRYGKLQDVTEHRNANDGNYSFLITLARDQWLVHNDGIHVTVTWGAPGDIAITRLGTGNRIVLKADVSGEDVARGLASAFCQRNLID